MMMSNVRYIGFHACIRHSTSCITRIALHLTLNGTSRFTVTGFPACDCASTFSTYRPGANPVSGICVVTP